MHPENTMPAFAAAIAMGYRYLETDVHATADDVLIAFHDDRLDRVTDARGIVAEQPWSVVSRARVGGEPIVRFDELLAAWPEARINVDAKHDAAVGPLVRAIRSARALDRVCIGSFSGHRLDVLRTELGPGLCTSLAPREVLALRAAAWRIRPLRTLIERAQGRCVQVPLRGRLLPLTDRGFIAAAHQIGLPVHVWTVNDAERMEALLDLGVDGLMTDRPTRLREVLVRRGAWHGPPAAVTGDRPTAVPGLERRA